MTEQSQITHDFDMQEMEHEWRTSQKPRTEVEWLNIFPEAKKKYGRHILNDLKLSLKILNGQLRWIKIKTKKDLLDLPPESKWRDELIANYGESEMKHLEKEIRHTKEQIALLHRIGRKPLKDSKVVITETMIAKAKEYPIEQLLEINRQGFTKCFVHNDKKPSMYCKKNFAHCFVCNKSWDTIAVLVERDGLSFREAVLKLQ